MFSMVKDIESYAATDWLSAFQFSAGEVGAAVRAFGIGIGIGT